MIPQTILRSKNTESLTPNNICFDQSFSLWLHTTGDMLVPRVLHGHGNPSTSNFNVQQLHMVTHKQLIQNRTVPFSLS